MTLGRKPSENPRASIFQIRLTGEEREMFERLIEVMRDEAGELGGTVTGSGIIRMLVMREVKARGLDKPRKKGTKK